MHGSILESKADYVRSRLALKGTTTEARDPGKLKMQGHRGDSMNHTNPTNRIFLTTLVYIGGSTRSEDRLSKLF